MPVIFYSTVDPASMNIAKALKENFGFVKATEIEWGEKILPVWHKHATQLVELNSPLIEVDFLKHFFKSDLFVFASKHKSASENPCYTVHATGNWGDEIKYGGNARELQLTSAKALQTFFDLLKEKENNGTKKVMPVFREATHHGPTSLKTPAVFVELGSSERQWNDFELAIPIAEVIVEGCKAYSHKSVKAALGFGGTHYLAAFENLPFAFSHVASKHVMDFVDAGMVRQAKEKTVEPIEMAFVDWKGCTKEQREKLIPALEENGLKWEKV